MKDNTKNNRIEEVMTGAIKNLRNLVDVDIVVGKPIETNSNLVINTITKYKMTIKTTKIPNAICIPSITSTTCSKYKNK